MQRYLLVVAHLCHIQVAVVDRDVVSGSACKLVGAWLVKCRKVQAA